MPKEELDPMELQQSRREGARASRSHVEPAPLDLLLPGSSASPDYAANRKGVDALHRPHETPVADRHPHCVVWTYLPGLTTLIPLIGHVGICTSEGVVHDFAGPYFVSIDHMAFNRPMRIWRLDPERMHHPEDPTMYDRAIEAADTQFRQTAHNLFCNNCHHHVAEALNHMAYKGRRNWTQFDVWWQLVIHGSFLTWRDSFIVWAPLIILAIIVLVCRFVLPSLPSS